MTALSSCGQPENLAGAASSGNEKYGIFDSHAHYDDAQFDADREELLGRVLPEKGVCGILNMGADLKGCKDTVARQSVMNTSTAQWASIPNAPGNFRTIG